MPMSRDLKNLAKDAFFEDDYGLAHSLLTEAIKLEPTAELYVDRAQVLIKLGKYTGAIDDCDSGIEIDGSLVNAFYRKGIALKHVNLFESAKSALKDGLKLAVAGSRIEKLMNALIEEIDASVSKNSGIGGNDEIPKSPSKVFLIHDKRMLQHRPNSTSDEENPRRIEAIIKKLEEDGLLQRCDVSNEANDKFEKHIKAVHEPKYFEAVESLSKASKGKPSGDNRKYFETGIVCSRDTPLAAKLAACAVVEACDRVASGRSDSAFALVRPPGHHAGKAMGSGFCYFNNIAIGAEYLKSIYGMNKLMIIDFDVHHGDGTQSIFYDDKSVLFCSVHRGDIFPLRDEPEKSDQVGSEKALGFNVNVNLKFPLNDGDLIAVFDFVFLPLADEFKPEFILVSAGYDTAICDKLGKSHVTSNCFRQLVLKLKNILKGKIVLALEGGYNPQSLSQGVAESIRSLLGEAYDGQMSCYKDTNQKTWDAIREVYRYHKRFWPVFEGIELPLEVT